MKQQILNYLQEEFSQDYEYLLGYDILQVQDNKILVTIKIDEIDESFVKYKIEEDLKDLNLNVKISNFQENQCDFTIEF
jgi:hypothetical protein